MSILACWYVVDSGGSGALAWRLTNYSKLGTLSRCTRELKNKSFPFCFCCETLGHFYPWMWGLLDKGLMTMAKQAITKTGALQAICKVRSGCFPWGGSWIGSQTLGIKWEMSAEGRSARGLSESASAPTGCLQKETLIFHGLFCQPE